MNDVCKLPLQLSYTCKSHTLGLGESGFIHCASPVVPFMEEVPDEVVLEDLCCHVQKMSILVPKDFP